MVDDAKRNPNAAIGYQPGAAVTTGEGNTIISEARCIGCGCTDSQSCSDGLTACEWVWVKREEGRGWCTSCDDGDWEVDPVLAAKECAEDNAR